MRKWLCEPLVIFNNIFLNLQEEYANINKNAKI